MRAKGQRANRLLGFFVGRGLVETCADQHCNENMEHCIVALQPHF